MYMLPFFRLLLRLSVFGLVLPSSMVAHADGVLILGDSISAGYGLSDPNKSWVNLLRKALEPQSIHVNNASISGDTSQGGVSRISAVLERIAPEVVMVELGGNDGLRGMTPEETAQNLISIVRICQKSGAKVLLLGMRIPPNYGKQYTEMFAAVYPRVAALTQASLVPFFLDRVAGHSDLMQVDGIHPNEKAQPILLNAALKGLAPLLPTKTKAGHRLFPQKSGGR